MRIFSLILLIIIIDITSLSGQGLFDSYSASGGNTYWSLSGFVRNGQYISKGDREIYHFSSSFTDLSLKLETGNSSSFRAYSDLRYRYGKTFGERTDDIDLREAWIGIYGGKVSFEAGKKIIKWGRTDFFNPVNIIMPSNDLYRSPDIQERELAATIINGTWSPGSRVTFNALLFPQYTPSVLPVFVMDIPEYVSVTAYDADMSDTRIPGYGIRNDYHLRNLDFSFYYFDGYNKLPGIKLDMLRIPDGVTTYSPSLVLKEVASRTRMLGFDVEGVMGSTSWRAEFAWSSPHPASTQEEHIPFPEVSWTAALDLSPGNLLITLEYGGKYIPDWSESESDPLFPGPEMLSQLALLPLETALAAVRQQIKAFNRLYMYQIENQYHMVAVNISAENTNSRWEPAISSLYNITTQELLIMPSIVFKPFDRVTARMGLEYWHGADNSLYEYLSDPLSSVWMGVRIDF